MRYGKQDRSLDRRGVYFSSFSARYAVSLSLFWLDRWFTAIVVLRAGTRLVVVGTIPGRHEQPHRGHERIWFTGQREMDPDHRA